MIHSKQHIADIAEILFQKGIANVIISPGSRNAPIIEAFYRIFREKCISVIDERSAAYVGLGIARTKQLPVVLICTSGSAVLNYAPALAEAYYQHVPLIAITADRPSEWIDQLDNQTIKQENIYSGFIKANYNLPQEISTENNLWHVHRIVNEAFNTAAAFPQGPVHINVPLNEPLYLPLPASTKDLRIVDSPELITHIELPNNIISEWKAAKKILIIHGQDIPQSLVASYFEKLLNDKRICIIAENISNVKSSRIIENPDIVFSNYKEKDELKPDLIIVSGLQVVSKQLKEFLRNTDKIRCWRIGPESNIIDTYQQVNIILKHRSELFYKELVTYISEENGYNFQSKWIEAKNYVNKKRDAILTSISFSDLKVMDIVLQTIPAGSVLEIGNSSPIRYSQFFSSRNDLIYYSNRGVSGIDGCLSTAVGTAMATNKLVVAVLGDMSFVYDSNALWNREFPSNLRIIIINNKGGGIFSLIDGPKQNLSFDQYVNAYHPANIKKLIEGFGLKYYSASNEDEFNNSCNDFYKTNIVASVLEVYTSSELSSLTFKKILGKN